MFRRTWRALATHLARARLHLTIFATISAVAGFFEAAVLVIVVRVAVAVSGGDSGVELDIGVVDGAGGLLWFAAILTVAALGLQAAMARMAAHMAATVLINTRASLLDAFTQASWAQQSREREGSLQDGVATLAIQSSQVALSFENGLSSAVGLAALLTSAAVVDPLVTLAVIVLGALLFVALRPLARVTHQRARSFVDANTSFSEEVSALSTLAMELRSFGVEDVAAERLHASNREAGARQAAVRFASRLGIALYRQIAVLLLVGAVAVLYIVGEAKVVEFGAVVLLVVRALSYAQGLQNSRQLLNELSPNLSMLQDRIRLLSSSRDHFGTRVVSRLGDVTFDNVTYSYSDSRPALRDVSFTVSSGETVGIVGPSGSGKSTLVQLLLRLRVPSSGTISVGGVRQDDISQSAWARLVALVPQEPRLMEGSITDNIVFFREGIRDQEVNSAARAARVADEILALPHGFETRLGPRGSGLSGGQKQRVAIARALAGGAEMIVMDEPTSALDSASEELIRQTIEALKGTVTFIIVAHRRRTLEVCDRILSIEHGRLRELPPSSVVPLSKRREVSSPGD